MKLKEVFEKSVQFFKDKKIDTPRLDAELLISHALKMDRVQLYVKYEQPLREEEVTACRDYIRRRTAGEPVAYIVEEKGFYGQIFKVGPGVLIPRPETEIIVEESINFIKKNNLEKPRILDLGAGSGCIGLAILKNHSGATLVSLEKSDKAFTYLLYNTEKLELTNRVTMLNVDIETYDLTQLGKFDVIVSNPPYINETDPLVQPEVRKFEPSEALFANKQGFELIESWSTKSIGLLNSPGLMLFEIGHQQGPQTKQHFDNLKSFTTVQILKDLSGLDRTIKSIR
jgi:release factor glutamine methyltransferase